MLGSSCLAEMNASLQRSAQGSEVEFCNASTNLDPRGTVLIFGGKGLTNAQSLQNEFLNQMLLAQLVNAPSLPPSLVALIAVLSVVSAAALVAASVLIARHHYRQRKLAEAVAALRNRGSSVSSLSSSSVNDPLLAVRSPSGTRLLEGYQRRLQIPFERVRLCVVARARARVCV